ncbi:LamG-like jellyroll fold domain-containing protein [Chondromyces crocatus]|uniref:LamG-like jellyroll fold domain-containing protein n=1 Tax=Chondromyces crocatus TaxID=52 RepID=UPI0012E2B4B5|nr:LamG-like jellyroll fold domain-containing protein [Chondromyces crocatus]
MVVRYFINASDGAVGSVPQKVPDTVTPALDLDVEVTNLGADMDPQREGEFPHGGLAWSQMPGNDGRAWAAIGSGKLLGRLNGKQAHTVELVVRSQGISNTVTSRLFGLHARDANDEKIDRLSLVAGGFLPSGRLGAYWNQQAASYAGDLAGQWTVDLSVRQVVHLVMDTNAPALERVRLYVNGSQVPGEVGVAGVTPPSANEPLSLQASDELILGNSAALGASFQGVLYYAAVYDEALDEPRIAAHACALLASDDAPF